MIDYYEEPMFFEDEIDYCTIDEDHCHEYEDAYDNYGTCVPLHSPGMGCIECEKRYN